MILDNQRTFRLDFKLPEYLRLLPNVFDRCDASRYFAIQLAEDPKATKAIWYARASLNEFKSAMNLITIDMKSIGLKKEWIKSTQKSEFEDNLLIKMISICRNLSFHLASVTTIPKERNVRIIGPDGSRVSNEKALFVDGTKNYEKTMRGKLTPNELKDILEIEKGIPLHWILAESRAIASICLENFLVEYNRVDINESDKFWNRAP